MKTNKKIKLSKNLRIVLLFILSLLALIIPYLIYRAVNIPIYENQTTQIYSYNQKTSIKPTVFLKPNNIYTDKRMEEGKVLISEFVDFINTEISYEFAGDNEANIKGDYTIYAKVEGTTGREDKKLTIWEKDFPLIQKKRYSSIDGKVSINEEVKLYLADYNTFVTLVEETTKIKPDSSLTLIMDINLTGTTEKGTFEENITPNIVIPLNTPMFEITTNNIDQPGAIEETIQVQQPINKTQVIIYGVILGILALGLIFLIFFTKSAPKKDPLEKELNKIFKKHGDRLVALSSYVDVSNARNVRAIDDLVKLADEINKPIFYKYSDDYKEINKFFIKNDDEIYVLDLEYLKPKEEIASEQLTEELTTNIEE